MASKLLSSLAFHGSALKNRVVLAPMTRARTPTRVANAHTVEYYKQRSNAGLLITEATNMNEQGIGWSDTPGCWTQQQADGWKKVTEAVHEQGSKIYCQLWHMGRVSHSAFHNGKQPVAPSAIRAEGETHTPVGKQPYETPRALTSKEIGTLVKEFKAAAELAMDAGFDGVELHGANGYLIDQFLQSRSNNRSDLYGGSIENRFRFLREIIEAVSVELPPHAIAVRISPNGVYNDMGSPDYREQYTYVCKELSKYSLGYLHVMDGLGFGFHKLGEPFTLADVRANFKGPIIGNVGYTKETAEAAIASGNADLIAFGRPYITNPDLVDRFANGWPLAEDPPYSVWYGDRANPTKGYTDYPPYKA